MKKHQLQDRTQCIPESEEQALEILKLAEHRDLIMKEAHTHSVLRGCDKFNSVDGHISYGDGMVFAFSVRGYTTIPTNEFIQRLKGEWVEPETTPKSDGLKPITEWYEQLPEPYKSQALHNYIKFRLVHSEQHSLADAIKCFGWYKTKQGGLYWHDLYKRALNGEFDSKPEAPQPAPQPKPIGLSKETKILLSVLLRREFDSLPWYSLKEAAPIIIKAASELELTKLVKEMRSDLNFDIKKSDHEETI